MKTISLDLSPLEIAKEKAARDIEYQKIQIFEIIRRFRRRRDQKIADEALFRFAERERLAEEGIDPNVQERMASKSSTVSNFLSLSDLAHGLNEAVEIIEKIGLSEIPIYISTLDSSFDLASVRGCIESDLEEIYQKFTKSILSKLKFVGVRAKNLLKKSDLNFEAIKNRLYKELQIQSHKLCEKIAKSHSRNSKPQRYPTITPVPNLKFVKDEKLKLFASTAAQEACKCFDAMAFNAAAVMAGSATESVLLDLLLQNKTKLKAGGKPLEEWRLVDLITTALKLNLLGQATGNLAQIVRQHRNLIHPGRSLREKNSIGRGEAEITLGILRLVCDELS